LAVFVDGCYWHRCPEHHIPAKRNAAWWASKLDANVARDRATDEILVGGGWCVLRFWEHEPMEKAADVVEQALVAIRLR
jgi:DNA mismatch endonuclease (patch repair protein)